MWECGCGCRGIAADLPTCPMCEKGRVMPKGTSGGASNGWEQPDGEVFEMAAEWSEPDVSAIEEQPAEEEGPRFAVVGEAGPETVGFLPAIEPAGPVAAPRAPRSRKGTS